MDDDFIVGKLDKDELGRYLFNLISGDNPGRVSWVPLTVDTVNIMGRKKTSESSYENLESSLKEINDWHQENGNNSNINLDFYIKDNPEHGVRHYGFLVSIVENRVIYRKGSFHQKGDLEEKDIEHLIEDFGKLRLLRFNDSEDLLVSSNMQRVYGSSDIVGKVSGKYAKVNAMPKIIDEKSKGEVKNSENAFGLSKIEGKRGPMYHIIDSEKFKKEFPSGAVYTSGEIARRYGWEPRNLQIQLMKAQVPSVDKPKKGKPTQYSSEVLKDFFTNCSDNLERHFHNREMIEVWLPPTQYMSTYSFGKRQYNEIENNISLLNEVLRKHELPEIRLNKPTGSRNIHRLTIPESLAKKIESDHGRVESLQTIWGKVQFLLKIKK